MQFNESLAESQFLNNRALVFTNFMYLSFNVWM